MTEQDIYHSNFAASLGIGYTLLTPERVEGTMPLGSEKWQPWGFVHGGATLSFLETLASRASEFRHDPETEAAFGVDVHVRHKKPAKDGMMHGYAELDREEPSSNGIGRKQYWKVAAFDEVDDVISEGVIMTKVVPKERLAQKEKERAAARQQADEASASCENAAGNAGADGAAPGTGFEAGEVR